MSDARLALEIPGGVISALLIAAALVAVIVIGLRHLGVSDVRRRRALIALRVATALAALLVAIQPTWSGERLDQRPGRLAVLFDASRSGIVRTGEEEDARTRADEAEALAARWSGAQRERAPDVYTFGAALRPARLETLAEELAPIEDDTRLAAAIEAAAEGPAGDELGAVLVVSDGADLAGGALETATRLGLRVHAVALGAGASLRDDAIAEVRADRVGFLRRTAMVRVTVRRLGESAGEIPVALMRGEETLRETAVVVPEDGEATVDLAFTPDRLGRSVYRVVIPTAPGDAVPQNNERAFLVRVARDNLRVLLVAGQPSWDERFLRAFLTRDPTTDLISFFILRNTSDMTMAQPEELALIPFPTDELFHEHLGSFDVVLFQNFEYAPYQMAGYLPRIRDYVMRGGSFAMIGGPLSFSAAGYAETPIAEVLPVGVLPRGTAETQAITTDRFQPVLAEDASRHPLVALLPDARANAAAWAALSPLQGLNVTTDVRSGGQRLLQHPTRRDRSGAPLSVLVSGSAGRGRVMALMTDTSWRWGMTSGGQQGDASAYERFWDRALRWLSRDPALEPARIETDRESYGPSARMRIDASLADERYVPLGAREVTITVLGEADRPLASADVRTDGEGRARVELVAPDEPGGYRVVAVERGATDVLAEEVFVVESGGQELADPRPRPDVLRELAARTGGEIFEDPEQAPDLERFDATRVRSLGVVTERPFASPWAFLVLVALFGAEWILRRRWGAR
ncbi:glutamine amidotransferase [Sandaracinus amylolyticus]|uniref:glutamine amidotransferase n=1 Tax=Sandaracinus amylolyticus TaxID=927083 RepID=UPI001F20FB66|nr:glutamine amidotransferase [Sandaracinus amylolyticus]UJR79111.1 Threonine dehydrogenase [Sandaracinus amylolyticus]